MEKICGAHGGQSNFPAKSGAHAEGAMPVFDVHGARKAAGGKAIRKSKNLNEPQATDTFQETNSLKVNALLPM